jgi:Ig-like domain CHU_C associated/Secretion system C-terminal sorting domain
MRTGLSLLMISFMCVGNGFSQSLPTPPTAVTKTGRFGLKYTFVSTTLQQQLIDNEPNHRIKIENVGSTTKNQISINFTGLNADGTTPTLSGGGFAVFPNGGYAHLRAGDTTVAQGWSAGWRECSCITEGINDKLVRFIVTYDSTYYGPDGLPDGTIRLADTILQPIKIIQKTGTNLYDIAKAIQTDATQSLSGYIVIPHYIKSTTSLKTMTISTDANNWPLYPSGSAVRLVDSLGNQYAYFNVKVNPRGDYRISAEFNSSSPNIFVPKVNIVVPSTASNNNLTGTALPYGKALFTVDSITNYMTETGFWRVVFSAGDSTVTAFPGQENWFGSTTDAKNVYRAKSKIMKFSVANSTYGQKLWEKALPFESWGGAASNNGKVVVYMLNQSAREANLHNDVSVDWIGVLDGVTGARKWGLRGDQQTMEGLEVGVSSGGDYIALGTTGSGRLTMYRNNGGSGTKMWSNAADFTGGDTHLGQVRKIVFTPDDQYVYAGCGDMYLRKYRVSDGSLIWKTYIGGWPFVNGIAIANGYVATGTKSKDRTLVRESDGSIVYLAPTLGFDASIDSAFNGPVFGFGPIVTDRNTGRAIASVGGNAVKHSILEGQFVLHTDTRIDVYERNGGNPLAGKGTGMGGGNGENTQSGWATPQGDRVMLAARDLTSGVFPRIGVAFFRSTRNINRYPTMDSIGSRTINIGDTLRFKVTYRDYADYNEPSTALSLGVKSDTSGLKTILRGDSVIVYASSFAGSSFLTVGVSETSSGEKFTVSERVRVTVSCNAPSTPTATTTSFSYCQGATATVLSATPAAGTSLVWYTTANGGSGSATAPTPSTTTAGTYNYYAASGNNGCESTVRLAFTVSVKPLPAGSIEGGMTVCQNTWPATITFTGSNATAPYTFTYTINGGTSQTVSSGTGNTATITAPTNVKGSFLYALTRVDNANGCGQAQTGTTLFKVNPNPAATISGTTSVCVGALPTPVTFTGSDGDAPYTFTYRVNGGPDQQIVTTSGSSVQLGVPTGTAGTYTYTLLFVHDGNGSLCRRTVTGNAVVTVNALPAKPVITRDANGDLVSSATSGNQWYKDGVLISGATGQTYKATTAGNYTVVVTQNGCKSPTSDAFNFIPTGLTNLGAGQFMHVYPNPAQSVIRIDYRINGAQRITAVLHDLSGKEVWKHNGLTAGSTLPVSQLAAGTYLLTTMTEKGKVIHHERVVIQ